MPTPDRFPGAADEEGIVFEDTVSPTVAGEMRYVSGAFQLLDAAGEFPARSGIRQAATVVGTTSTPTTTSTSYVVIPQMTTSLTIQAGSKIVVLFSSSFRLVDDDEWELAVHVDGVEQTFTRRTLAFEGAAGLLGLFPGEIKGTVGTISASISGLAAGARTIDVRWRRIVGACRAVGTQRSLTLLEVF